MPTWALYVTGFAAVVVAVGVIWRKVLEPLFDVAVESKRTLPVLRAVTDTFGGDPSVLLVIREIAAQFRTDSGTTLRDIVNGLADSAEQNRRAVDLLRIAAEGARALSEADRVRIDRFIMALDRIDLKVDANTLRIQVVGDSVADHRVENADRDAVVAEDLEASHLRAEAAPPGSEPGEAADAAAQRPTDG